MGAPQPRRLCYQRRLWYGLQVDSRDGCPTKTGERREEKIDVSRKNKTLHPGAKKCKAVSYG